MQPTSSLLFKVPLLLGIIWANRVTYTSPNPVVTTKPPVSSGEASWATINMRPPWLRAASRGLVRGLVLLEVASIVGDMTGPSVLADTHKWISCPAIALTPTFLIGWLLLTAGALIRKACYRELGKKFTFEVTIRDDHRLVTSGPYSVVRHPSYTGLSMVAIGSILALLGSGSWLAGCGALGTPIGQVFTLIWLADVLYVPSVMAFSRVKLEDDLLKRTFGQEWHEWFRRTPYALIPGIY